MMCAPCKIILDEEVEGLMDEVDNERGRRLARGIRRVLERHPEALSEAVQQSLIRADYALLMLANPDAKDIEKWRRRVYKALEGQAGYSFAG